jgi:hypothetical protein
MIRAFSGTEARQSRICSACIDFSKARYTDCRPPRPRAGKYCLPCPDRCVNCRLKKMFPSANEMKEQSSDHWSSVSRNARESSAIERSVAADRIGV